MEISSLREKGLRIESYKCKAAVHKAVLAGLKWTPLLGSTSQLQAAEKTVFAYRSWKKVTVFLSKVLSKNLRHKNEKVGLLTIQEKGFHFWGVGTHEGWFWNNCSHGTNFFFVRLPFLSLILSLWYRFILFAYSFSCSFICKLVFHITCSVIVYCLSRNLV